MDDDHRSSMGGFRARDLYASGGSAIEIQDLVQHVRELLDIIADGIALTGVSVPESARGGLEQLRERLVSLESDLVVKH